MTNKTTSARQRDFQKIWERWQTASRKAEVALDAIRAKYTWAAHPFIYANKTERGRYDRALAAENKAALAAFAWLDDNSPRDWRGGAPVGWIRDHLTFDDAITRGALSEVPPPAYGSTAAQMRRFAAALERPDSSSSHRRESSSETG